MSPVVVAFLLGLAVGLWVRRGQVARRSEVIRWAVEDIDRLHDVAERVEETEDRLRRFKRVAIKARRRAAQ